jgi:type I restriction enzyme M protein
MSELFLEAARNYLGYTTEEIDETTPFERRKIAPAKVAYVVEQLQGISLTRNDSKRDADVLGEFFEGIVAQDFTQTKGQFFTPINLVRLCLEMAEVGPRSAQVFTGSRDDQGRPTLPYIIDPSAGSGTFLIEAMKLVTSELRALDRGDLSKRQREFAGIWFGEESPNYWARDYIYGVEPNADLGLAVKVNMILHGDGSTNTFVRSGLLPFGDYARGGRSHVLGMARAESGHAYTKARNEEFDFIFTNPPFALDLSEDEKKQLRRDFELGDTFSSEAVFVERWYQLLREGGRAAAILPESVLDTSSSLRIRVFLLQHFRVVAAVSLPYVAFKPFTSTKTCILLLEKRTAEDVQAWRTAWELAAATHSRATKELGLKTEERRSAAAATLLREPIASAESLSERQASRLEWARANGDAWVLQEVLETVPDETVFMAEPEHVGYKRRKGLKDLPQPNSLFGSPRSVLEQYRRGPEADADDRLGFWVSLSDIANMSHLRLDPKYHGLWTLRGGRVFDDYEGPTIRLGELLEPVERSKVAKGPLATPRMLIDLEHVEARTSRLIEPTEVEEVGSDRVEFGACHLAVAKLEPYLGKVVRNVPEEEWIGSPEWLLYKVKGQESDIDFVRFLLLLPEMLDAYRCLQSGKRHARLSEDDLLNLRVPAFPYDVRQRLAKVASVKEATAEEYRRKVASTRREIDSAFWDEIADEPKDEEA